MCSCFFADENECELHNDLCAQQCRNFPGGFDCSCTSGFGLAADERDCVGECDVTRPPSPDLLVPTGPNYIPEICVTDVIPVK